VRAPLSLHDTGHPTPNEFYEIHLPIGSLGLPPGFSMRVCPGKTVPTQRTDPLPGPVSEVQRHNATAGNAVMARKETELHRTLGPGAYPNVSSAGQVYAWTPLLGSITRNKERPVSLACPNCGSAPDPRDLFCGTCGHPVRVHAPEIAEALATPANGRSQWSGRRTSRTSQAAAAREADQRTYPQRPVRDIRQVSRDVPEPRGTGDGGWDDWTARSKTTPRPAPASAASESSRPASASARPAEAASAAAASGSTRVRNANPRDQAESGAAAADPLSYITADDRRMGYADLGVSGSLDPLSNSRCFWQLARRFALYFVLSGVISFALWVLAFIVTASGGGLAAVGNGGGVFSAMAIIDLLITAALMALFLFMPVSALLGQWSRMLTFQAPAAASVLDRVQRALDRPATPRDNIGLRALCPPGERRDYLELRRGYFVGYVSCFPHGWDLYVGWTFWIYNRRSGFSHTHRPGDSRITPGAETTCTRPSL
jgi:hypothetical protein